MSDISVEHRVVAVETKLDSVIKAVGDLAGSVKDIANRPSNIAWREIAITIAAFLGLFTYFDNYVAQKNGTSNAISYHRLQTVEKALCLTNPAFCVLISK